jgi:uncharacterized protein with PIN domain
MPSYTVSTDPVVCLACGGDLHHTVQDEQTRGDVVVSTVDTWHCANCNIEYVSSEVNHIAKT